MKILDAVKGLEKGSDIIKKVSAVGEVGKKILSYLLENDAGTVNEIAEYTGIPENNIEKAVAQLLKANLVEKKDEDYSIPDSIKTYVEKAGIV